MTINCRCTLLIVQPTLVCDECGERRPIDGVTFLGEIHGCGRLGAFRLRSILSLQSIHDISN